MYLDQLQAQVSQGDIFDGLPLAHVDWQAPPQPTLRYARAVLLTFNCEYDKPNCTSVLVAEIKPLRLVPENLRGNVRRNRVASAFSLSSHERLEESYVDFRNISTLDKRIAESASTTGQRILSLNEDARLALQEQLYQFFGYGRQG